MEGNYDQLVAFIAEQSGIPVDDIERQVTAKQEKLSGLISKEGAAQVIAAELHVRFDTQHIKLAQIVPGMRKINSIGQVVQMFPVREFEKNGKKGRVASFVLADDTSNMRVVLWDENHIDLIVDGKIEKDAVIEIGNASVRNGELHLSGFSEIAPSDQVIENLVLEKQLQLKSFAECRPHDRVAVRGFILQIFAPRFFEVCPTCRKKVVHTECAQCGVVVPDKRALVNIVFDDGSDTMRAVLFSDVLGNVFMSDLENPEAFSAERDSLIGKEVIVEGNVRKNAMFGNHELIVSGMSEVDIAKLLGELEA